jgi:ABC-type polysaccharide/polyol phosphate export permease
MRFVPAVVVYVGFHIVLQAPTGPGLLLLPVLFAIQLVMMLGLALLVSTLVALFTDASNAIQYLTRIMLFTTPVIFPVDAIPPEIRDVLSWQPFFALFAAYQEVFGGDMPGPGLVLQAALWAIAFLVIGTRVFLRHERELAMRL